jgi:hypothetical protein
VLPSLPEIQVACVGTRNKQTCSMWLQETSVVCPIARLRMWTGLMHRDVGVFAAVIQLQDASASASRPKSSHCFAAVQRKRQLSA